MPNSQGKIAFIISKNDEVKKAFDSKFLFSYIIFSSLDLWHACSVGALDVVRILIREGESANQQTQIHRNTPLHIAAKNGTS